MFGEYNTGKRMLVVDGSLFDQTTNTLAVMVKNQNLTSSDCWFDIDLTNYTFPSVGVFGAMAYTCEDAGMGIRAIAPYLPARSERYVRSVANVDYFFIGSGRNTNNNYTTSGAPWDASVDANYRISKNVQWLSDAVAASTAEFKFIVTHDPPHSHAANKSFQHNEYMYDLPALSSVNGILHGDDHLTQILQKPNPNDASKDFFIIGASNFRNSSRVDNGLGGTNANEWTVNYKDLTAQNNYYVELKSTTGLVRIQLIDGNNSDPATNVIYTQYITN